MPKDWRELDRQDRARCARAALRLERLEVMPDLVMQLREPGQWQLALAQRQARAVLAATEAELLAADGPLWPDVPSYVCPGCGHESFHPGDIANRYCSSCRRYRVQCDGSGMWGGPHIVCVDETGRSKPERPYMAVMDLTRWRWFRRR